MAGVAPGGGGSACFRKRSLAGQKHALQGENATFQKLVFFVLVVSSSVTQMWITYFELKV